jgi:hypothetical protein
VLFYVCWHDYKPLRCSVYCSLFLFVIQRLINPINTFNITINITCASCLSTSSRTDNNAHTKHKKTKHTTGTGADGIGQLLPTVRIKVSRTTASEPSSINVSILAC